MRPTPAGQVLRLGVTEMAATDPTQPLAGVVTTETTLPRNSLQSLIEQHGEDAWPLTLF